MCMCAAYFFRTRITPVHCDSFFIIVIIFVAIVVVIHLCYVLRSTFGVLIHRITNNVLFRLNSM